MRFWYLSHTVKPVLSSYSKRRPKLVYKTDYRLKQVKSIAECSNGSILQNFQPSLSYYLSLRSLFCLFLSGRLRQVLLYTQMPLINAHADMSSGARGLFFCLSLNLYLSLCMQAMKSLARLRTCADLPETTLLADGIHKKISCAGKKWYDQHILNKELLDKTNLIITAIKNTSIFNRHYNKVIIIYM